VCAWSKKCTHSTRIHIIHIWHKLRILVPFLPSLFTFFIVNGNEFTINIEFIWNRTTYATFAQKYRWEKKCKNCNWTVFILFIFLSKNRPNYIYT
jgi:hypothetical protein